MPKIHLPFPAYTVRNPKRNSYLKKILIAGYPELTANYEQALSALGASYCTSLSLPDPSVYDALILPGGGDIAPNLFGQINCGSRKIDSALDRLQLAILKSFVTDKKPVLGICKGMQLINVFFGGDICQHLPTASLHEYQKEKAQDEVHETRALPGSFLHKLYGERFCVNSAHHQGADLTGKNIQYIQYADDDVPEGLIHTYLPIWGVQWHPERMCFFHQRVDTVDGALLLSAFLNLP